MLPALFAMMLLAVAGLAGCRGKSASPGAEASAGPPQAHAPTAASSPPASSRAPSAAQLPYEPDRGCVEDVDLTEPPAAQLDAVGRWCARGLERIELSTSAARPGVWRVELGKHACVLAAVAGSGGLIEQVRLRAPDGRTVDKLGRARLPALLGPACVSDHGIYELEVGAPHQVMVGIWRAPGPSDAPER